MIVQDHREKAIDIDGQDQDHQNIRGDIENLPVRDHIQDHCLENIFVQDTHRDLLKEGFKEVEVEIDLAQGPHHGKKEALLKKVDIVEIALMIELQQLIEKLFCQSYHLQSPASRIPKK